MGERREDRNGVIAGCRFRGVLFLVGMPRSGTKLLRDLLNNQPDVAIPEAETNFFPAMIGRFGAVPQFDDPRELARFWDAMRRTPFYWNMEQQTNRSLSLDELRRRCGSGSWASVVESVLRFYAPAGKGGDCIPGDKSPGNVRHIELLARVIPESRFVHIIRDPRDQVLSVRKAWGKSVYRAAERWRRDVQVAHAAGHCLGGRYCEVHYEDLLADPAGVVAGVCAFLGCEFHEDRVRLERPSENLGAAKGLQEIVRANTGKFGRELSPREIRRIEEIVSPVASELGYTGTRGQCYRPLGKVMSGLLLLHDFRALLGFYVGEKGLFRGALYLWRSLGMRFR